MMTIRSRAIELAADPTQFQRPVPTFSNPGDAKLEADAYLALCIDQVTDYLSNSSRNRRGFFDRFSPNILDKFGLLSNQHLDHDWVKTTFIEDFRDAYVDGEAIDAVFNEAPQVPNTEAACQQYLKMCKEYVATHAEEDPGYVIPAAIWDYESAANLMHLGLMSLVSEVPHILKGFEGVKLSERPTLLGKPVKGLAHMGSLSLSQLIASDQHRAVPRVEGGRINTVPNLQELRDLPLYSSPIEAALRPHRGCPAMPELPPTGGILKGGSGILKMASVAMGLMQATNVHMLESNLPEHSVTRTAQSYGEPVEKQIEVC